MLLRRRQNNGPGSPYAHGEKPATAGTDIMQLVFQGVEEIQRSPLSRRQKQKLEQAYLRSLQRSAQAARDQLRETLEVIADDHV